MGAHANPVQPRPAKSVVFELTMRPPAGGAADSRPKRTFALDRSLRIGADAANHIVIDGAGVGAFHARFIPGLDSPILVLSGSEASIDGLVVQGSVGLIPGDLVVIGEHQLSVLAHGTAQDGAASRKAAWQLVADDGAASVELADSVIIGSANGAQICLTDADVAPRHVQLVPRNGALWVRDFSDGATFVNDEAVSGARRVAPGDALRIGQHQFRVSQKTRTGIELSRVTAAVAVVDIASSSSVAVDTLPSKLTSRPDLPVVEAQTPAAVWEIDEPADMPIEDEPVPVALPVKVASARLSRSVEPKAREASGEAKAKPRETSGEAKPKPRETSRDAQPKPRKTPADAQPKSRPKSPEAQTKAHQASANAQMKPRPAAPPPTRDAARGEARRIPTVRIERRASMRAPARVGSLPRGGRRASRWRVPLLIVMLTLAWAVAMSPAESTDRLSGILGGRSFAEAFAQTVDAGRSLQRSAVDWLSARTGNAPSRAADTGSTPAAVATVTPARAVDEQSLATRDILELQRNAAAGNADAIAHLKELRDFYAQLAASATSRGDTAAAQRHLTMVRLLRSPPTKADSASPGASAPVTQQRPASRIEQPASQVEQPVSPVEALLVEAQQLMARGAIVSPERRNAINVLLEALQLEPANESAGKQLNSAIRSLNSQIDALIADGHFMAAGTVLEQLARSGVPVLSNGNVRDRPSYLDAESWRALAISSLLVEADALIQRGLVATPGSANAISLLVSATRIDPGNSLVKEMRVKSSGILLLAAERADEQGRSEEAQRLVNLAAYVRDGFGA